jgi:uncharacterized protein YxeA
MILQNKGGGKMKKIFIIFTLLLAIIAGAGGTYSPTNYNSSGLEYFSDGVKYDAKTNTIYTKGKMAKWAVQRAERAYKASGDKDFWIDNNLPETSKNYKCVKVEKIVYGK